MIIDSRSIQQSDVDRNASPAVVEMLVAQVEKMVQESGDPKCFDARSWLLDWLHSTVQRSVGIGQLIIYTLATAST
jgi:hypothetical protein